MSAIEQSRKSKSRVLKENAMPAKKFTSKKYVLKHKDGSLWAKGQTIKVFLPCTGNGSGKTATRLRSGYFENGEQTGKRTTYDKTDAVYKVTTIKTKS